MVPLLKVINNSANYRKSDISIKGIKNQYRNTSIREK